MSEPHGDSGCDHLCVARVKCGAIIKCQQIPSTWWTSTTSRNGRRHAGAPHCSGGAVVHQLRNSHVRESSFFSRTGYEFRPVIGPEKRTLSNCSTLRCACAVAQGPLPPREEEPPCSSAHQDRHKKILPRVTTAHPVLAAVQPARRRRHEKSYEIKLS